jgi:ferredoxin
MHDPDILAIRRKRRQESRCVRCGEAAPRASLCRVCRACWRYCPACEAVYPLAAAHRRSDTSDGRASEVCPPCKRRARGWRRPMAQYLADHAAHNHPLLVTIIRLYRRGLTRKDISVQVGRCERNVKDIIDHARRTGRWPAELRHGKGRRRSNA